MEDSLVSLRSAIQRIYRNIKAAEKNSKHIIAAVHRDQKRSMINLIHYLALRRENLRPLQDQLHDAGLSSLASAESHTLWQVQAVLQRLGAKIRPEELSAQTPSYGSQLLKRRADTLFGNKENPALPHLMVTFESSLAENYAGVKALLKAGMDIARINAAHDNAETWKNMVANIRKGEKATGKSCKVYFDLPGPKIRTVLLGKGRKKGRMNIREQEQVFLAEADADFSKKDKVVGCTLPGIVKGLNVGDRVLFDDGLFEALVEIPGERIAILRISRISASKGRIKPEKGINFPDSELTVHSLTDFDKSLLPFAQKHADILGFSFVRAATDVAELQELLGQRGKNLPLVIKIETLEAVQNLPALLMQGMQAPVFGVMIARGDLAVEIGFERLSEIQEEILWLCEAAHVPVIWATQVLESLNKSGIATRSEVTDVVLAGHAECIMLNKGKHLLAALATLQDILLRSGRHHSKKRYVFRPLQIAERFFVKMKI
jgi:pyruvate kinase